EAKDINQRIALETFVEINLAADGRDADAIAVMGDAADDAGEQSAIVCNLSFPVSAFRFPIFHNRSEAQRVQTKLRARPHGKDVANDSADPGGRALEWLDRAGVIVALH